MITMNHFPRKVFITDGHLFLFGKEELVMIPLGHSGDEIRLSLEEGVIVDS